MPDNLLVRVSRGEVLPVVPVVGAVDVSAFSVEPTGPLPTRAVSESVGIFSFISRGTSDDDLAAGDVGDIAEVAVGEAGVTVTAGVDCARLTGCDCEAIAGVERCSRRYV